jgi:hypothetical protein
MRGEAGNGCGPSERELLSLCIYFATGRIALGSFVVIAFAQDSPGVRFMQKAVVLAAISAMAVAVGAEAKPIPPTGTPPAVQQLIACRSITDSVQRLACYDRQAAALDKAIATKDVVVIDKAKATATKRSLFGFSIPDFGGLFGGGDDIKQIDGTVAASGPNGEGGWTIKLADGSLWTQTDDAPIALPPERGDKVVIKRGALGSFFLELGKQPGVKVRRIG